MSAPCEWTVLTRERNGEWTAWSQWVDRATAEAESAVARDLGYQARIVRADSAGAL